MKKILFKLLALLFLSTILAGCAGTIDLAKVDFSSDGAKDAFIKEHMGCTGAHKGFDGTLFGEPKIDPADLKGKKLAIVSFTGSWSYKNREWIGGGASGALATLTDMMADSLKRTFESVGLEVIPVDQLVNNEAYRNYKSSWSPQAAVDAIKKQYVKTAYGLKKIPPQGFTRNGVAKDMAALGKALDVDYVVIASADIYVVDNTPLMKRDFSRSGQTLKTYFKAISVDMFSTNEPKEVWSMVYPQSNKGGMLGGGQSADEMILIPTYTKVGNRDIGWFNSTYTFEYEKTFLPEVGIAYDKIGEMIAYKFKKDRM